jgi:hypothetical protein
VGEALLLAESMTVSDFPEQSECGRVLMLLSTP